jgi:hypothetical protein
VRRAREDTWAGDEVPWCRCAGAGPPLRRPLAAGGCRADVRRRAMRRCWRLGRPDLHVPCQASTVALEVVAIDAPRPYGAASGDRGLQAPLRRGGGVACTECALLSWRPPSTRSAVYARGPRAPSGHWRRSHRSGGHCSGEYLLERARVPAEAAAVAVQRARVDAWVGDEVPMSPLRWRRATTAAPTRCGRPSTWHASPCDAPVWASGATKCRWRHYHRHRCPCRRARLPLGWLPSTPGSRVLPPPATEATGAAVPRGGALPAPGARYRRGSCRRRAVPCAPAGPCAPNCHWRRSHQCGCTCSSERVFLPMPRPSPYDAHVLYARAGDEVPLAPLRWRRTTPRRPLDAVGRREDMRCRAMRQCWRLG